MSDADAEGSQPSYFCRGLRLEDWPAIQSLNRLRGGDRTERTVLEKVAAFGGVVCMPERGRGPIIGWAGYLNSYRAVKKSPSDGLLILYAVVHPEWCELEVMRSVIGHLVKLATLEGIPRVYSILPAGSDSTRDLLFRCGMLSEAGTASNGDPVCRMSFEVEG